MPALSEEHLALLKINLETDYIPLLPPLLEGNKSADDLHRKNLSRALSAFALRHILNIPEAEAAGAVIDDFNDQGIDAIYLHGPSQILYIVQTKLKAGAEFKQEDALPFCQGARKLLVQEFSGFNAHFTRREAEIADALNECIAIQFVISHIGPGISQHAETAINDLIKDPTHGIEHIKPSVLIFDARNIVPAVQSGRANRRVNEAIEIYNCHQFDGRPGTYFGYAQVADLVSLYQREGDALFDKNIRLFLGPDTEVSKAIQNTLKTDPAKFFFFNNGITAVCEESEPPRPVHGAKAKRISTKALSIINGAQTVSSASQFAKDNPGIDISPAKVAITLISAGADLDFSKNITRSRNHQNNVDSANFLALDDQQERLRRELAVLGIQYSYKAERHDGVISHTKIKASEAVHALALFTQDPRYALWLKNEPSSMLDIFSERYKILINERTSAFTIANAVRFARYVNGRMRTESIGTGPERLAYNHGAPALGWVLAKRVAVQQSGHQLFDPDKVASVLSAPLDELRNEFWGKTNSSRGNKTPLVIFRSQTHTLPIMEKTMITNYKPEHDKVVAIKQASHPNRDELYPEEIFKYTISKAPQIGGLV